eukprot:scaffold103102_cov63-Phaeocystis_antarctica.AAC.5
MLARLAPTVHSPLSARLATRVRRGHLRYVFGRRLAGFMYQMRARRVHYDYHCTPFVASPTRKKLC